jgi:hypothetical protein
VPGPGPYALVVAAAVELPLAIPVPGAALPGLKMGLVPATATSTGIVDPSVLRPAGGTARGAL